MMRFITALSSLWLLSLVATTTPVDAATIDDGASVATSTTALGDNKDDDNEKIEIELYYESQCPGCRETITQSFKEAYDVPGFLKMAKVTFVPYGNARETNTASPYEFECQHGPSECSYNLIEACLIEKISCPVQQFSLLNCIESYDDDRHPKPDRFNQVLIGCSLLVGIEKSQAESIKTCVDSSEGNTLMHDLALKTGALDPPHQYVPWIVVDGTHDDKTQNDIMDHGLFEYVCDNYTGPNKSPACPENDEGDENINRTYMIRRGNSNTNDGDDRATTTSSLLKCPREDDDASSSSVARDE